MPSWSSILSNHFHVNLPPDVVAWFDDELWKECSETHFSVPLSPEMLLDSGSSTIWGGLMLPDTLPILHNGGGDTLSLRFNSNGSVSEVIRWEHEGGNWTPFGATLSEAILLDIALSLEEEPLVYRGIQLQDVGRVDWVLDQLEREKYSSRLRNILEQQHALSIGELLEADVAVTAVRRMLSRNCCASDLQRYCWKKGCHGLAENLGVHWFEFSQWVFDSKFIPDNMREKLAKAVGIPFADLSRHDWSGAVDHAERVVATRTDLGWPFAVLGWAAERQGDLATAVKHYAAGLTALGTSSDFTEYWEKIGPGQKRKFVVDRLMDLSDSLPEDVLENDYFRAVAGSKHSKGFFDCVRRYWSERGESAEREGRYSDAYQSYYVAGWDMLVLDDIEEILDALARNAQAAGFQALASIAIQHRKSMI
ncbi:MAG: hypothetical protein KDA68_13795 [Planctomycetaceae bacterium]|nr:hypothetical protein [Planctomycetaceae bacterium]